MARQRILSEKQKLLAQREADTAEIERLSAQRTLERYDSVAQLGVIAKIDYQRAKEPKLLALVRSLPVGVCGITRAEVLGGARTPGYSPVHEAISRIAAVGAPERGLMTAGFVTYGAALLAAVPPVRRSVLARAWPAVVVNGVATWAVAALPLDRSAAIDAAHGVAATVGYGSLAAVPALAAAPLVAAQHLDLHVLAFADVIVNVPHKGVRDLRDVHEAGLAVLELDERTEIGNACDAALHDRAGIKLHQGCPPESA